jgi:hypothetical protein
MPSRSRFIYIGILVLAAVVLITYQPALRLNFYGDDYSFVELAGRSSLTQYLAFYFDPRVQTGWYRPIQGMLFGIEWILFGGNPTGYHAVNVLVHLVNCLLLFTLVARITYRWRAALLSALIYAGLPLISVAVFWPGDADFLLTCFYLSSLLCWIVYLQQRARRFFVATFIFFLLALLTKEFGATLPLVLLLADQLLLREYVAFSGLVRRYAPFVAVYVFYLPLEFYIQSRSVLTNMYGYRIADHVVSNFWQYLAALAFPWRLPEPFSFIWLGVMILGLGYIGLMKRDTRLVFLCLAAILAFLPVTPFPWFFTRYLYLAVMATAIIFAFLFERLVVQRVRWIIPSVSGIVALLIGINAFGVAQAAVEFAELGRQTRVPFRDIAQRHITFPDDTYLYFINPPTITSQLSGMFFLRYGAGVHVASNEASNRRANLRDHTHAYVIWFDEERRTRELPVEKQLTAEMRPAPPIDFTVPVRLEGYELGRANITRDQAIVLILYWRVLNLLEEEYVVVTDLVDTRGNRVAQSRYPLRMQTPAPFSVDAIVLPAANLSPGEYRVEIKVDGLTHVPIILTPIKVSE